MRSFLRPAAIACLLAACAQAPQNADPLPALRAAAVEANVRADAQFRRGDFERAAQGYREALRLSQSIEDTEDIATNAINLSIALQRLGKYNEAHASLAPVLDQTRLAFPPPRLAQAALRRAILHLDEGRRADAGEWADKAATLCARQSCAFAGAIHNVKSQLALDEGRLDAAAASARAALAASRSAGERAEAANALRLLGMISLRTGDAAAALGSFNEALAIDRQLALPHRIYLDLLNLGRASAARADNAAAKDFYQRALTVSEADRDSRAAAEARVLIEALGDNH